ncbi:hypothetical protein FHS90_003291 [Rufibacter quisquiliarum]|uniref:Uncharacterized protein n=1 Tax=Rufibacter quisquiliarum TaxID=1549639 RepID=A0A839GXY4_9BACT|nr:hypothetical protein [Rufibacter quisquiliarum]
MTIPHFRSLRRISHLSAFAYQKRLLRHFQPTGKPTDFPLRRNGLTGKSYIYRLYMTACGKT